MSVENREHKYPCTLCMGFCDTSLTDSVVCCECNNRFHQRCAKLSNRNFERLKSNQEFNSKNKFLYCRYVPLLYYIMQALSFSIFRSLKTSAVKTNSIMLNHGN